MKRLLALALLASAALALGCDPFAVTIDSPVHGSFSTASAVTVSGRVSGIDPGTATLTLNGVPVAIQPDRTWSAVVALDPSKLFQPMLAQLTANASGDLTRARVVVIRGDSRADGAFSDQSVALRLNDSGLDQIEPIVTTLFNLDLATLLPVKTLVINDFCVIRIFVCLGTVDVRVANPPPSLSSYSLDTDSMVNFVAGDVFANNPRVDLSVSGAVSCGLRVTATQVLISGDYALGPDSVDASNVNVDLIGAPGVAFTNFNSQFTSGICDAPLIGDLIQAIVGDIQPTVVNGLRDFLRDPDGVGPLDAPVAEGIEQALANVTIAGPLGEALGVTLEAPLHAVTEDDAGITLDSHSSFVANVGTGTGQCPPVAGAPDLAASYHFDAAFPSFGPNTPGGTPYGVAIAASPSAFNQLLKAQVECGLLVVSLTQLTIPPLIPDPTPITSDLLAAFVPEFSSIAPGTPMRIDITPTLAPVITDAPPPPDELAELLMSHLTVHVVVNATNSVMLGGAVDARVGLDIAFTAGELLFQLGAPAPADVQVAILENPLGTSPFLLEQFILPGLIAALLPDLAENLAAFPLPQFLGLNLQGVDVDKQGDFFAIFANLTPSP